MILNHKVARQKVVGNYFGTNYRSSNHTIFHKMNKTEFLKLPEEVRQKSYPSGLDGVAPNDFLIPFEQWKVVLAILEDLNITIYGIAIWERYLSDFFFEGTWIQAENAKNTSYTQYLKSVEIRANISSGRYFLTIQTTTS